jgi:DNA-binding NarL/FixJ family response regulator
MRNGEGRINIGLVNEDPVLQLGLKTALATYSDLQVVAEAVGSNGLERLAQLEDRNLDVAIAEWTSALDFPNWQTRLQQFQQLKRVSPRLRILLLSPPLDAQLLTQLQQSGIDGYCVKGSAIAEIVEAIRQVAAGNASWSPVSARSLITFSQVPPSPLQRWLFTSCQTGMAQIEANLAEIGDKLSEIERYDLDWLFWTGRQRELRVARWLVSQFSPGRVRVESPLSQARESEWVANPNAASDEQAERNKILPVTRARSPLALPDSPIERALAQIQLGVENRTGKPLEIDILQRDKRQELLYLVLRKLQDLLEQLRFLDLSPEDLPEQRSQLLQQLWQASALEFMGKYSTDSSTLPIAEVALQESPFVRATILEQIPFVLDLFSYLLYETPLVIDRVPYSSNTPEARARAKLLLDNLVVRLANSVMQLLLNFFAEENPFKFTLYDRRYRSSREIARLRNELSWKYRQDYYIEEPKAIFESQYRLLVLEGGTIRQTQIAAPRRAELETLQGLRWFATITLETRDAIAPRLRSLIGFLGRGTVYVLTQVLGRGLGLIGRGIIQGFGNAWSENRYGKNTQQGK